MEFRNQFFKKMFIEATKITITKDSYSRLCEFEHMLNNYFRDHTLTDVDKLEYHYCLAIINKAQIRLLEEKLGVDLDNDGLIGVKRA